jgi:pseudaminic acid biosynthesis-associated methylase
VFTNILQRTGAVKSVLEFGANIGHNLRALTMLLPEAQVSAIEINPVAVKELEKLRLHRVYAQSILDFVPDEPRELVLIAGVLIHINPDALCAVYEKLYKSSSRYIVLDEYYNPTPVEISYRGHKDRLFKRDFAGEMLDQFPGLSLAGYGFVYHRDPVFPTDDSTWFLLEKRRD